jgi:hypothetical protein
MGREPVAARTIAVFEKYAIKNHIPTPPITHGMVLTK